MMRSPSPLGALSDRRGAVYVEFLIAFMPLLVFFMCLIQLAGLHAARLEVLHAAETAVRAAIVVLPDDPAKYNKVDINSVSGKRRDDIVKAASLAMAANKSLVGVKVTFPSTEGGNDDRTQFNRDDLVRVQVSGMYRCSIPIARRLVCGMMTGTRKLKAEAAMPNQGASYTYD